MSRAKSDEIEQLKSGLDLARPLDDLVRELATSGEARQLYAKGLYYVRWTGCMMSVAGIYFLALKEKVGHGGFKKMFLGKDAPVSYMHVWQCMKAAHVVAEHPVFGGLRSSRAFRSLLCLPGAEQKALANEMRDLPEEEIDELLPGKIQKRYDELKDRRPKHPRKKTNVNPDLGKDELAEEAWQSLCKLYDAARGAMNLLADAAEELEMKPEYFDRIFERDMLGAIGDAYGKLITRWHPIEEVQKRAVTVKAGVAPRS